MSKISNDTILDLVGVTPGGSYCLVPGCGANICCMDGDDPRRCKRTTEVLHFYGKINLLHAFNHRNWTSGAMDTTEVCFFIYVQRRFQWCTWRVRSTICRDAEINTRRNSFFCYFSGANTWANVEARVFVPKQNVMGVLESTFQGLSNAAQFMSINAKLNVPKSIA